MRVTFYAALFAATATATYTTEEADNFADYLWAQIDAGEMTYDEGQALAEQFADDWEQDLAELETEPELSPAVAGAAARRRKNKAQAGSDGIIADAKWLGGKMWSGVKAAGRGIDAVYDGTKNAIKATGKAIYNAPGNAAKAVSDWKKRHNFAQGGGGGNKAGASAGGAPVGGGSGPGKK